MATATKKPVIRTTGNQITILNFLAKRDDKVTTQFIADGLNGSFGGKLGFDAAYACLKRLEVKGLVKRFKPVRGSRAAIWAITAAGKKVAARS